MGYDAQEGVLPVMADTMRASGGHTQGADPVAAPFLRYHECDAAHGCAGHGKSVND